MLLMVELGRNRIALAVAGALKLVGAGGGAGRTLLMYPLRL